MCQEQIYKTLEEHTEGLTLAELVKLFPKLSRSSITSNLMRLIKHSEVKYTLVDNPLEGSRKGKIRLYLAAGI